ncbi:MAG: GIY-YIG nuclease family protein [Firmicutes bacterium]|nr:GIY-YIG nuclease family protein [Bacillota bacterium]
MSREALEHHVYIVECRDGTLYTGYAGDLEQRLKAHNQGKGAKYTRGRRPVRLVYRESFESKSAALRREHQIKAQSREAKLRLIQGKDSEAAAPQERYR